jgi:hypothetical protein
MIANLRSIGGRLFVMPAALLLLVSGLTWSQDSGSTQVPAQLAVPEGEKLVLRVHAKGDQIYTCKKTGDLYTWTLKEPQAELFDEQNKVIGHHSVGPSWTLNDGSQVVGKVSAKVDFPDSIPWLLLSSAHHSGNGVLSAVTSIQRLHTKDGNAPASGCDAAHETNERRVGYTADYLFYAKP